jgi:triacylglycerol lipase
VTHGDWSPDRDGSFTGAPSKRSQRVVAGLRAVRTFAKLSRIDVDSMMVHLMTAKSPPRWLVRGLDVTRSEFAEMPVWTMRSAAVDPATNNHVVCLHGGGYIHEATFSHWRNYATLARDTGASICVPVYPVSPRGTAATVVPQIADLIATLITDHGADAVGVYGDSAGGGLALAATQELVRRGGPTPAGMVLVSPWLDVTMTDPGINDIDDPALSREMLADSGRRWAGALDPAHPWVSPLFGSLSGLPPTTVYSGSLDMLCVDTIRLRANAIAEGADINFVLRNGLIHDWVISPLPEAVAVRPDIYRRLLPTT